MIVQIVVYGRHPKIISVARVVVEEKKEEDSYLFPQKYPAVILDWWYKTGTVSVFTQSEAWKSMRWRELRGSPELVGEFRHGKLILADSENRALGLAGRMVVDQMMKVARQRRARRWTPETVREVTEL